MQAGDGEGCPLPIPWQAQGSKTQDVVIRPGADRFGGFMRPAAFRAASSVFPDRTRREWVCAVQFGAEVMPSGIGKDWRALIPRLWCRPKPVPVSPGGQSFPIPPEEGSGPLAPGQSSLCRHR